jgi:dipeptidyl aminopeptidase/acylaminoacyl peptidase
VKIAFILSAWLACEIAILNAPTWAETPKSNNSSPSQQDASLSATMRTSNGNKIQGETSGRAMVPSDLFSIRSYGARDVSRDRTMIAIEVLEWAPGARRESGDVAGQLNHRTELWLVSSETGKRERLTAPSPIGLSQWNPIWSPDSKHLAFLSTEGKEDAFLEVWDRPTGHVRLLSRSSVDVNSDISWIDDSHLLVMFFPSGVHSHSVDEDSRSVRLANLGVDKAAAGKESTAVVAVSPPDPHSTSRLPLAKLEIVDTTTGASRTVGELPAWQSRMAERSVVVAPNGKWAAVNVWMPPPARYPDAQFTPREMNSTRLGIVSLEHRSENGGVRWVQDLQPAIYLFHGNSAITWNPEGSKLAVLAQRPGSKSPVYLVQVDAATGVANSVPQLDEQTLSQPGNPGELYRVEWLRDGRLAVESHAQETREGAETDGEDTWWTSDGEKLTLVNEKDEVIQLGASSQRANSFKFQTSETGRLYEIDAEGHEKTLFPDLNPQLEKIEEPRWVHFKYRSESGKDLNASLLLPTYYKPGTSYPTVVWVYGGDIHGDKDEPAHRNDNDFLNLLLLAGHGYAVLFPSMPLPPEPGDPMAHLNNGVDPPIDQAVALGVVDPNRLAVMGHSYGGYSTFGLITQTHRYRAAVAMMGISDLLSSYGEFDSRFRYSDPDYAAELGPYFAEWAQGGMGVPLWADPERYMRNSPVLYANKINTPLLIVAGDLDLGVNQSEEMYTALQRQGKSAQFVRYLGEEHVLKSPANILDMWQRIFNWLDTYVKSPPAENNPK